MAFQPVHQQPDLPQLEQQVLRRWTERDIFSRSLEARAGAEVFSVYEGPPTANGTPGVHHVPSRTFKDVYPRYRTMKGYRVPRQGGWDCHGIPVEVQVERELGFNSKSDIEAFGIEQFNAACRESVQRYVGEFKDLSERIGYWVDWDNAYWTMNPSYVESVWWSLKQLWDSGLIYQGHRVVPYCARCGTALSDHEVAQGYAETDDPSVYVTLPVTEGRLAEEGASLVIWTTTPWTLLAHGASAIGTDIRYVLADGGQFGPLVLAADLVEAVLGEGTKVIRDVPVDELIGTHYEGPFGFVGPGSPDDPDGDRSKWCVVVTADYVTTSDGTGIVSTVPAFGADDMETAKANGLPYINPVDLEGKFDERVLPWAGQFVKDADPAIVDDLRQRGRLLRSETYTHNYPFCWRCHTPLLYYAKPSWYIATTKVRDRMLEENAGVNWYPETLKTGRYGKWLENNVDWALSRERYWGTPLPIWRADDGDVIVVGSLAELGELAGRDLSSLDPHRPYVDDITFARTGDDGVERTYRRVPEVIDAWYDSGSMPFAQFGYPWLPDSEELFEERFPADFIFEGVDQTRGWFYSLMAVSTLIFDQNSYRNVKAGGMLVDEHGLKMSKSRGNVLDPWDLIASHGADALRWHLLTSSQPWLEQRLGPGQLDSVVRKYLLTLWNTYFFFVTYARLDGWTPDVAAPPAAERPVMDRWILAELTDTIRVVDEGLERYDSYNSGTRIAAFVDDLSNWYVRRCRSRFWAPDGADTPDKAAAFHTLWTCLTEVTKLTAPFTPFLSDELYENLVGAVEPDAPQSVHLADFPGFVAEWDDPDLRTAMAAARQVTELGRRARNDARVGVRQPLAGAMVTLPRGVRDSWPMVADLVAAELNVRRIILPDADQHVVSYRLKPNFRALGPTFGKRTKQVAAAINDADAETVAASLHTDGTAVVDVDGDQILITADHVEVSEEAQTGWELATGRGYTVALDLTLDDELRAEGLTREFVRAINDLRKQRDLQLDDRIALTVAAPDAVAGALNANASMISADALVADLRFTDALADGEALSATGLEEVRVDLAVQTEAAHS